MYNGQTCFFPFVCIRSRAQKPAKLLNCRNSHTEITLKRKKLELDNPFLGRRQFQSFVYWSEVLIYSILMYLNDEID